MVNEIQKVMKPYNRLIEDALEEDEVEDTAEQPETEEPDEPDTDAEEE